MTVMDTWDQSHNYPWETNDPAVWPPLTHPLPTQAHEPDATPIPAGNVVAEEPAPVEPADDPDVGEAAVWSGGEEEVAD